MLTTDLLANVPFAKIWNQLDAQDALAVLLGEGKIGSIPQNCPQDLRAPAVLDWLFYSEGALKSNGTPIGLDTSGSLLLGGKKPFQVRAELENAYDANRPAFVAKYWADKVALSLISDRPKTSVFDQPSSIVATTTGNPDLTEEHPNLLWSAKVRHYQSHVLASGGNSASSFKTNLIDLVDHSGCPLVITSGDLFGQIRTIVSFDSMTGVVTLDQPLASTPAAGTSIVVPKTPGEVKADLDLMPAGKKILRCDRTFALLPVEQVGTNTHWAFFDREFRNNAVIEIVSAENASGLVEITTAVDHGWSTGDCVVISDVSTIPDIEDGWFIIVTDTNKFILSESTWAGSYSSGGRVQLAPRVFIETWLDLMPQVWDIWFDKFAAIGGQVDSVALAINKARPLAGITTAEREDLTNDPQWLALDSTLGFDTSDHTLLADYPAMLYTAWQGDYVGQATEALNDVILDHFPNCTTNIFNESTAWAPGSYLTPNIYDPNQPLFGSGRKTTTESSLACFGDFQLRYDWSLGGGVGGLSEPEIGTPPGYGYLNEDANWNSFLYELAGVRIQALSTTRQTSVYMAYKSYSAQWRPGRPSYYHSDLYYEMVFHALLSGSKLYYYLLDPADLLYQEHPELGENWLHQGDHLLFSQALDEAQGVLRWKNIKPILNDPPGWDEPFAVSAADTGGMIIYRVTPRLGTSPTISLNNGSLVFTSGSDSISIPGGMLIDDDSISSAGYWVKVVPPITFSEVLGAVKSRLLETEVVQNAFVVIDPFTQFKYPPATTYAVIAPGTQVPDEGWVSGGGRHTYRTEGKVRIVIWNPLSLDQPKRDDFMLTHSTMNVFETVHNVIDALEQYHPPYGFGTLLTEPMRLKKFGEAGLKQGTPKWGYVTLDFEANFKPSLA